MGTASNILQNLQYLSKVDLIFVRDKCNQILEQDLFDEDIQLPIDPIGDSITLGEMDDKMYNEIDKKIEQEITEAEYNDLFQQDRKDQYNEVEKDIRERSQSFEADRPIDP